MFVALGITVALILAALVIQRLRSPSGRYPPGPKPLPVIGNILDIPTEYQWRVYGEWKKTYGQYISSALFNELSVLTYY